MKNKVAQILQVYAWLNGGAGAIAAAILWEQLGWIAIIWAIIVIFVSFLIYAFGEMIELLHQIRVNTGTSNNIITDNSQPIDDELPEI